jgi:hypothetical protein
MIRMIMSLSTHTTEFLIELFEKSILEWWLLYKDENLPEEDRLRALTASQGLMLPFAVLFPYMRKNMPRTIPLIEYIEKQLDRIQDDWRIIVEKSEDKN